jgi:HAMP domain-containing protein
MERVREGKGQAPVAARGRAGGSQNLEAMRQAVSAQDLPDGVRAQALARVRDAEPAVDRVRNAEERRMSCLEEIVPDRWEKDP